MYKKPAYTDGKSTGAITKDETDPYSNPSLLVRLSTIADDPKHRSADQASKLRDGWKSDLTKDQVLVWRKRVVPFLKQNEVSINRPF